MVIGLPALRIRGLFLAVVTLAFALATSSYLLNQRVRRTGCPSSGSSVRSLFGRIAVDTEDRYYYFALAGLAARDRSPSAASATAGRVAC